MKKDVAVRETANSFTVTRCTGQDDISQPLRCAFQQYSTLPSSIVFQQGGITVCDFSFRKKDKYPMVWTSHRIIMLQMWLYLGYIY